MLRLLGHISLSGLILLSTTGLTLNLHFCQEGLYDIALNAPADNCCEAGTHDHHRHPGSDMEDSDQCVDETITFESVDVFFVSENTFGFDDVKGIDLYRGIPVFPEIQGTAGIAGSEVHNYRKPPPSGVTLSQIQTFLI